MNFKKYINTYSGLLFCFLLIISSIPFQSRIDESKNKADIITKSLYVSSSALKKISLGYDELLADIYWIRALQFFSNTQDNYENAVELYKYFDLITDLDPYFINAYRYGGTFLADQEPLGLGEIELGINLLDKGRKNNPDNFRIPLDEAFIYFLYTKEFKKTAQLFIEASEKDAISSQRKASFRGMAALALSKGGELQLSKQIWSLIYNTTENEGRRNFALKNLLIIRTKEYENQLTDALKRYYTDTGSLPDNVNILINSGYSKPIPPLKEYGNNFIIIKDSLRVRNKVLSDQEYKRAINFLNSRSRKFKTIRGRYPFDLAELKEYISKSKLLGFPEHPYGGKFTYNPSTGKLK